MATNFMDYTSVHTVAESTKLKATTAGHIYNIQLAADADNGIIVKKGNYVAPEYYAEAAGSATFAGKIIGTASNGNYLVEVTAVAGDLLVLQAPLIYEEYNSMVQNEKFFYNKQNDIVRAYELYVGDVFTISADGFVGTPVIGKAVSVDTTKKLKVATA